MSTTASAPTGVPPAEEQQPLSEPQRIINTYVAPTKTFTDIRRNARWWAPWLLGAIIGYLLVFAVGTKVGWEQVNENQIKMNPRQEARMEQIRHQNPEQYTRQLQISVAFTKGISYAIPIISLLIVAVIAAVLLIAVMSFLNRRSLEQTDDNVPSTAVAANAAAPSPPPRAATRRCPRRTRP